MIDPSMNTFCKSSSLRQFSLELAAAHVEDAIHGRGKYGKAKSSLSSKTPQLCFKIFSKKWYKRFFWGIIVMHATMILFEAPSVHVSSVHTGVYVINFICLLVYTFDVVIRILFLSWSVFWSTDTEETYWNGVEFILTCMFWFDYVFLIVGASLHLHLYTPFRCFRLVMILCKVKNIRHIFIVLLRIFSKIGKVAMGILIFVMLFACIGVHLFMDTYNQMYEASSNLTTTGKCCLDVSDDDEHVYKGAFDHVGHAMLRLFVLLSTENYPEFMAPAYRAKRVNFLYFGFFIFVGVFFMTAFFLAIIVDSYWKVAKIQIKRIRMRERAELAKAWNILDPCGTGSIACNDSKLEELFAILKPKNTVEQNEFLIELVDSNQDGLIDSYEWTIGLIQILEVEFEDDLDDTESIYTENQDCQKTLETKAKYLIENASFSRGILMLIIVYVLLFTLHWKNQTQIVIHIVLGVRVLITSLFLVEAVFKVIGLRKKILRQMEALDLILVLCSMTFNMISVISVDDDVATYNLFTVLSSVCVFLRLFLNSAMTRKAFLWFLRIAPVMMDLLVLLLIIMYFQSVIGMELFQGYTLDHLSHEKFYSKQCGIGFDTFFCSLLMIFQMLTTSNWHEIMNMVLKATKKQWTPVYFVIVYIVMSMVTMNLFVAIAIEAANKLDNRDQSEEEDDNMATTHDDVNDATDDEGNVGYFDGDQNDGDEQNGDEQSKTFTRKAANVISRFAENVFTTARTEDLSQRSENFSRIQAGAIGMKRRRRPTTFVLKNLTTGRKISTVPTSPPKRIQVTPGSLESLNNSRNIRKRTRHLIGGNRKTSVVRPIIKAQEVNGMNSNKHLTQCRVIVPASSEPMNFEFGEVLNVITKIDDWVCVQQNGHLGWIPANHVIMLRKKKIEEPIRHSTSKLSATGITEKPGGTPSKSHPNYKIKKAKPTGNWTRSIISDMVVMYDDEMKELNKVMRAEIKAPQTRTSEQRNEDPLSRWRKIVNREILESTDDEEDPSVQKPLWMSLAEQRINNKIVEENDPPRESITMVGTTSSYNGDKTTGDNGDNGTEESKPSDFGTPVWIQESLDNRNLPVA